VFLGFVKENYLTKVYFIIRYKKYSFSTAKEESVMIDDKKQIADHLKIKIVDEGLLPESAVRSSSAYLIATEVIMLLLDSSKLPEVIIEMKVTNDDLICFVTDKILEKSLVFRGSVTDFIHDLVHLLKDYLKQDDQVFVLNFAA
jgi:hypothetical protein